MNLAYPAARQPNQREDSGFRALLERGSLLILFFGIAFHSMLFYALGGDLAWLSHFLYTRYSLIIALPACLLGCLAYRKYGGFARSLPLAASVLLLAVALSWTDSSELGRGLLNFTAFAVTLPIAALVVKHNYTWACQKAFLLGTAVLFLKAVADPEAQMILSRFGYMQNSAGQVVSNPNTVGLQAALAVLFVALWTLYPEQCRSRIRIRLLLGSLGVAFFSYVVIQSASRTAFVALTGVLIWIFLKRFRSSPVTMVAVVLLCLLLAASWVTFDMAFSSGGPGALDRINDRLFRDAEETVGTLGDRTRIWSCAWDLMTQEGRWIRGFGTGGGDKQLGRCFELGFFALGRDGIKRVHSHNTLVEWALMSGVLGLLALAWLGIRAALTARRLDRADAGCSRTGLLLYILLLSFGGVVNTIAFWLAIGPLVWALLTPARPPDKRTRPTVFRIYEIAPGGQARPTENVCV